MPNYNPTPDTWTIKFKNARTTIVLHVDQLQTLSSIKTELLHAINSTNPSGTLNGLPLPESPDDIELAKPRDFSNLETGGWQSIELDASNDDLDADLFGEAAADATPKNKGKGKAKARGKSDRDCLLGAGLKDMAAVAFRFKGQEPVPRPADDDIDEGLGLEEVGPDADGWDVELPKFEDVYGLENLVPDDQLTTPKAEKFTNWI